MDDLFLIAEITDIFSNDGSVIIKSFSDFPERFVELEKVIFDFFGKKRELDIEFSEKVENKFILKFRNFDSEEDVSFLIGKKLYVNGDNLYSLPENTHYVHDLIDCDVYIESVFFGKLEDVLKLPGSDVYLIRKKSGQEVMIPAVERYIHSINTDEKKIIITEECKLLDED